MENVPNLIGGKGNYHINLNSQFPTYQITDSFTYPMYKHVPFG